MLLHHLIPADTSALPCSYGPPLAPSVEHDAFKARILAEIELRQMYKERELKQLFKNFIERNAAHRHVVREVIADLKKALNIH